MTKPSNTLRKRTIVLPDVADHETLLDGLRRLDEVISVRIDGSQLEIEYHFPATGFDLIWPLIKLHVDRKQFGLRARLRYEWLRLCEANEREHLLSQYGWDVYVRDIHVASHLRETERRNRQPRKPWQQAKRPGTP